jgi:hypothetical protein
MNAKLARKHTGTGVRWRVSKPAGDIQREREIRHVLRVFRLPFVKIMGGLIHNVVTT